MSFITRLEDRVREVDSLLCVGLDPHPEDLARASGEGLYDFCMRIVELTQDVAAAYKPNAAFFEALGPEGYAAMANVISAIPESIPVILDAKRGDIASTAEAYAIAAFKCLGADAITSHLFLGMESVAPFIRDPEHGVFMICKTSNPGAADIQELVVQAGDSVLPLYQVVARIAERLTQNNNIGLVVGATDPSALTRVRVAAPSLWILAPGVGAQGADLNAALRAGLRGDGMGLLVPVSRGIVRAEDPGAEARRIVKAINRERKLLGSETLVPPTKKDSGRFAPFDASLADDLLASGCVKFGSFTLKSGLQSPIYFDLRLLSGHPRLMARVASAFCAILHRLTFNRLAAVPYAGLPIATAISMQSYWPMVFPRKEAKAYGTGATVEGGYAKGEVVVVIDDLATTGGSKVEAIEQLESVGLEANDVVVLIDRQSGATEDMARRGCRLHAVFTITELLDYWGRADKVPAAQLDQVRKFLADSV